VEKKWNGEIAKTNEWEEEEEEEEEDNWYSLDQVPTTLYSKIGKV
jgi:hypothetical protein